jgi:hypothetical protein
VRYLISLFTALVAGLVLGTGASEPTPAQIASVDTHLAQVGRVGDIPREFVAVMGVNGATDGQIALAVLYTHERPNGSGNDYHRRLAVFLKSGTGLSGPLDIIVGGAIRRGVTLRAVTPESVVLDALNYAPQDPACCPSIPGVVTYRLLGGALVEAGSPNKHMQRAGEP